MSLQRVFALFMASAVIGCSEVDPTLPVHEVTQVEVQPENPVLAVGDTLRLTAYAKAADGTVLGGQLIGWENQNDSVVSVSANGGVARVVAHRPGTALVRATARGKSGVITITVLQVTLPVASVQITPADTSIVAGQSVQLHAVARAADGTVLSDRVVQWSTGNPAVATIAGVGNSAVASAHATGDALISAISEGVTGTARVRVIPPRIPVSFITITPPTLGAWVNQAVDYVSATRVFSANGTPLEGRTITWSVSDPTIARMETNGAVRTLRPGSTQVMATSEGVSGRATLVVFAQPVGNSMQFGLTYDWWDGDVRIAPNVGTATYTDSNGTTYQVALVPEQGSLTIDKPLQGNRYEQELVLAGYAYIGGVMRRVVEQRITDRGTYTYDVINNLRAVFTSETRPGYSFTGQFSNYEFHVFQTIGTAALQEYRYRLPH